MVVVRIAYALASVSGLGILLGLGLALAARVLAVRRDERIEAIEDVLPGANCGACGFAGCAAYAAEIVGGEVALDLCTVGGSEVAAKVAQIMGVEYESGAAGKRVPQVHCRGAAATNSANTGAWVWAAACRFALWMRSTTTLTDWSGSTRRSAFPAASA